MADPTLSATAALDTRDLIGAVSPRLFGSFVEHMGRGVYSGLFEPDHPTADTNGFRTDVLELVREMGVTLVRYPGGNFVSGYRWEDGVGPVAERPARLDLAWHSRETNAFGLDEFMAWTQAAGVEAMLTLNLGTRGIREALDLLEYAEHPRGTELSDLRIRHGRAEPYGIRTWCLGNEPDGPWQLGHKTAAEYGRLAAETARAMRQFGPDLRLVVAGSSAASMPTFGVWERAVLGETHDLVDAISLHAYYEEGGDLASFLASAVALDHYVEDVTAIVDEVTSGTGSSREIGLAVDEWNVWYMKRHQQRFHPLDWPEAPAISEDAYTVADAVVVGSLLISLLKHADRVTSACQAQLVNTIAPIKTVPGGVAWREASFFPFAITAAVARGLAFRLALDAPMLETASLGDVPIVDAVATLSEDGGKGAVFAVNRGIGESIELRLDLRSIGGARLQTATVLADADVHAVNTLAEPDRVRPLPLPGATIVDGVLEASLPPVSWAAFGIDRG